MYGIYSVHKACRRHTEEKKSKPLAQPCNTRYFLPDTLPAITLPISMLGDNDKDMFYII